MNIPSSFTKVDLNDFPTLAWIFGPSELRRYFFEALGKAPFYTRKNPNPALSQLIGIEDIDRFFETIKYRTTECFCVNGKNPLDVSDFSSRGVVDPRKALRLYHSGATLTLNRVHEYHKPLGDLCSSLSNELSAPCQANIYLTPPNAQGFKAHYDTHDTIIVQTSGEKSWRIYGKAIDLPLAGQGSSMEIKDAGHPTLAVDLHPGEVLYIPRGWVHEAITTESHSLHITLGVFFFTWADAILEYISHRVLTDTKFRESIPLWTLRSCPSFGLQDQFRKLLSNAFEGADINIPLDSLLAQLNEKNQPNTRNLLAKIASSEFLNERSILSGRPERIVSILQKNDMIDIRVLGGTISIDVRARDLVDVCSSRQPILARDVCITLSESQKYDLIRRLVAFEVLDFATSDLIEAQQSPSMGTDYGHDT
jgi:ribosomal protein L16 Arg81 hydroxylase